MVSGLLTRKVTFFSSVMQEKETTFNSDGSISETFENGNVKTTVFNSDGTIGETLRNSGGDLLKSKTTTFNGDTISEEVTA